MAILYNLKKEKDKFIIEVGQDTVQTLFYLSSGDEVEVSASVLLLNIPTVVPVQIDGDYKILLEVDGETSLEVFFTAFDKLQNSIIEKAEEVLCTEEDCRGCGNPKNPACLEAQSFYVQALSFETLFVDSYGVDFPLIFTNFLQTSIQSVTCKVQSKVNHLLAVDCIKGKVDTVDVDNLTALYTALYWAGMYFMEEDIAGEDEEQLKFVKEKFQYNKIIECLCHLCVDINTLKENYGKNMIFTEIHSFQFDGTEFNIDDAALVTPEWLDTNGTVESEISLLSGKNINNSLVGRIGFVITNNKDRYRFFDALGNDITDTVFDNVWDDVAKRQTYISKESYVPATIYYKFIKI